MTRMPLQPHEHVLERGDSWYAFDAPYQRLRLFSPWSIAGFGLAVCIGLTLGYPYQSLEEQLASSERHRQADRLTVEYLKVFLDAEPDAYGLRVQLVRQLMQLGSFAEARIASLPLTRAADARWRREAGWLELDMREQEAFAQPEGSSRRAELLAQVRQQLGLLLQDAQDPARLLLLARKALAIEERDLAASAFRRLATHAETLDAALYAEAARATLGLQDYRISADLYFRAMRQSAALDDRRRYFLDGLRTLQSGGLYPEAVVAADRHIGPLSEDRDALLFVARMAQAADRLDVAQRYALRLLKLALLKQLDRPEMMLASWRSLRAPHAGSMDASGRGTFMRVSSTDGGKPPGLPFDEEAYSAGYNIFLANRNLADARRVAASAVRQQPDSAVWRKRLAEVSEWSNAPQDALPQWLVYARMTGEEAAWDNVLRLAEGLHDTEAALAALQHKIAVQPGNGAWLDRLLSSYENAGESERALQTLQARLAGRGASMPREERRRELTLLAELAERMGRDEAFDAWVRLQREFGPQSAYALRIAEQLGRRGKVREAYASLETAAAHAPAEHAEFWRAYAELARLLQSGDKAIAAYRRLLDADAQTEGDLFNLISLLEGEQPLAAARAAMYGFATTRHPRFALLALNASLHAGDRDGALRFLKSIPAQALDALQRDPQFLYSRATALQAGGDLAGAERDLRAALVLRPGDSQYRSTLLWLLIARRDAQSLKRALSQWAGEAENDAAMWGPFAAANMAINRQADALHWFRKSGFPKDDYLWLMSYAEALEATSQPELAWRIRRRAWLDLRRPEVLKEADADSLKALRDRLASVAPLFMNGDGASALLRALLQADIATLADMPAPQAPRNGKELLAHLDRVADAQGTPAAQKGKRPRDDARMSAAVRELALAYALNREAHDLACAWLVSRFAQQLARPLWGELSLALAADDRQRLDRLLDELLDWLPMYDRIEAAQRAGRPGLAQTLAFDQMVHLPQDEELHARFTSLASARPPGFETRVTDLQQWPLARTELRTQFHTDLTPRLKLSLDLGQARQSSRNAAELAAVPAVDRMIEAGLRMDLSTGAVSASVHHRTAAQATTGLRLAYAGPLGNGLDLAGTIGANRPATETALLRVGAVRSGIDAAATYAFGKAEYLRFGLAWQRYATQAGTYLGSGSTWTLEAGTHLRIEYPNLTLRTFVSGGSYAPSGGSDSQILRLLPAGTDAASYRFLPQNDTFVGTSVGVGTVADNRYTRAWRPFGEIGVTHSRTGGTGFNMSGGIAGSVFGQDTLRMRALRSAGTPASPNGFREIGLDYKWLF